MCGEYLGRYCVPQCAVQRELDKVCWQLFYFSFFLRNLCVDTETKLIVTTMTKLSIGFLVKTFPRKFVYDLVSLALDVIFRFHNSNVRHHYSWNWYEKTVGTNGTLEIAEASFGESNSTLRNGFFREKSGIHVEGYGNIPGFLSGFQFRVEFIKKPSEWRFEKSVNFGIISRFLFKQPDFSLRKQNSGIELGKSFLVWDEFSSGG